MPVRFIRPSWKAAYARAIAFAPSNSPGSAVEVYDGDFCGGEGVEEGVGEDLHPAGAYDEVGAVGEDECGQVRVVCGSGSGVCCISYILRL
jgi:hypothetical protein